MSTVKSANNAIVDGMVRNGRQSGMTVEQMRTAGQNMLATLREATAANPLIGEYFPGLGQWATAISSSIETALADLTLEVPADVQARITAAYSGVTGNDRQGRAVEIGPLLRDELIEQINNGATDAELRTFVLGSQEVGETRRALTEDAFVTILGRGSSLADRNDINAFIDRRLSEGATLNTIDNEVKARVNNMPEKALLERVGMVFWQQFPEQNAPGLDVKRSWTDWVQAQMAGGMSQDMALMFLAQQLATPSSASS